MSLLLLTAGAAALVYAVFGTLANSHGQATAPERVNWRPVWAAWGAGLACILIGLILL